MLTEDRRARAVRGRGGDNRRTSIEQHSLEWPIEAEQFSLAHDVAMPGDDDCSRWVVPAGMQSQPPGSADADARYPPSRAECWQSSSGISAPTPASSRMGAGSRRCRRYFRGHDASRSFATITFRSTTCASSSTSPAGATRYRHGSGQNTCRSAIRGAGCSSIFRSRPSIQPYHAIHARTESTIVKSG